MCDFSNDCGDKSDEKPAICQKFIERCDFEKDTCNWYQDQSDDFDWTRSAGSTGSSATGPGTDHTTGKWSLELRLSFDKHYDMAKLLPCTFLTNLS